ncbi:GNAT family N-acetyltransferase [Cumulibacter manganitolerans]|uniref:GNAT family N-acetyltransferase n=1 Tax=Cumulibacter manganitolerans TaxID=1884992 RepID=UPI001295C6AF|nr:GNAT family N-acetyltransferase [Cumulibacter manganitolerans]
MVVGLEALQARAAEVECLLARTRAPATARWLPTLAWLRHHRELTPWTVLLRRNGALVGAAPLVRARRRFGYRVGTIGESSLPSALPAVDTVSARALAAAVHRHLRALRAPWVLRLDYLEITDPVLVALMREVPRAVSSRQYSPRLVFQEGTPLNAHLSPNTRSALAKARNRIKRDSLRSEMRWTSDASEISAIVPELIALYQRRTIQLGQNVSLLADAGYRQYFADMVHALAQDGSCRLLTHRLNSELAGYALCLQSADILDVYSNRMAPEWMRYSAGALANAEVIRMAHGDPVISAVDWGTGLQRYKLSGAATMYPHRCLEAWSSDLAYHAWRTIRRAREGRTRGSGGAR